MKHQTTYKRKLTEQPKESPQSEPNLTETIKRLEVQVAQLLSTQKNLNRLDTHASFAICRDLLACKKLR